LPSVRHGAANVFIHTASEISVSSEFLQRQKLFLPQDLGTMKFLIVFISFSTPTNPFLKQRLFYYLKLSVLTRINNKQQHKMLLDILKISTKGLVVDKQRKMRGFSFLVTNSH
jgi:hypothetical protein